MSRPAVAAATGFTKAIVRDVALSRSLSESTGGSIKAVLVDRVLAFARLGSVGSFHHPDHHAFEALPPIINRLFAPAGILTTVSDLLGH